MKRIKMAVLVVLCLGLYLRPADILAASLKGDVNSDGQVDLTDAVLINQLLIGLPVNNIDPGADVNEDGKIGLPELNYVLQITAGRREISYEDYFIKYPKVAQASVNQLDPETAGYFWADLEEAEKTGRITVAKPEQLGNWPEGAWNGMVYLTDLEIKKIWAAKVAHAIWLDKHKKVPWRLNDYGAEELKGLFDKKNLFDVLTDGTLTMISVVDYSPSDVFNYIKDNGLIKADQRSSLLVAVADLRTTDDRTSFLHGSVSYGDIDEAYSLYEALTTWVDRGYAKVRVSRQGGGTMSHIILSMLRNINIPGTERHPVYGIPGLVGGNWTSLGILLIYGDDLYSGWLTATPVEEIMPGYSWYENEYNINLCRGDQTCLSYRFHALKFIKYPSRILDEGYCYPRDYGFASCEKFIEHDFGDYPLMYKGPPPFLNEAELQTALDLCRLCPAR